MNIRIRDFTRYPGPRYVSQGPYSGEKFLDEILRPQFMEAETRLQALVVDLDGTEGYSTAFLDGSFGVLAREIGADRVLKTVQFVTNDEPSLEAEIIYYMRQLEV
jgi:hypothetical protein